jgi:hypothetical protein
MGSSRTVLVVALLLVPAFVFPLIAVLMMAHDTVFGDQLAFYQIRFDSRRQVVIGFLSDWWRALPSLYVLSLAVVLPLATVLSAWRTWGHRLLPVVGMLLGGAFAYYLLGSVTGTAAWVLIVAGALAAWGYGRLVIYARMQRKVAG